MSDKEKTNGSLAMAPRVITIPAANQETARKLRVAAYTRVSSNSKDQEHSFAAQNAYFSKLITDNPDWELADIYADQGITGTSIDKRDDFLRMMEDCRKGRIDRILVKSSSRFARNTKESLAAVRELKSLNISVYFEEQNIDTAQVSGEVLIAMFAALAQRESEANIGFSKDRVNAQLRQNAENRYRLFTLEYRPPYKPKKFPLEDELRKLGFSIEHSYDTAAVLVDTLFYIIITVVQIVAELADVMLLSPDLRAAEKDLKELVADYHFLQEHGIHTTADLQANIEQSKAELSALERERSNISNRIRRPKSPEEQAQNKERRKALSRQMKPVRERLRRAERILEKSPHLYELLKQEHELEKKARARYKERGR